MDLLESETLNKALGLFEKRDYVYAEKLLNQLLKRYPENTDIRHYQHMCLIRIAQEKKTSLLNLFLKKIITFPLKIYALYLFFSDEDLKALSLHFKLIKHFPLIKSYYWKAYLLSQRINKKGSISFIQEILTISPADLKALKIIGEHHIQQGNLAKAKSIFQKVKGFSPEDSEISRHLKNLSALEALRQEPFKKQNLSSPDRDKIS
ncbi:hypothetical protein AB834_06525 [PVC group bacterium (ex Bugula neritina AB1)]|nr:hypothetical protein AB834_06525 [PVC group bacterium (ex Bugula neritina AB1)]